MILWVGRFEAEKNPLAAVEVLQKVRQAGVDAGLILLGAGSLEPQLRKAAEGLPVEFPGWQPSAEYLPFADVVLSTSLHESYGASIVEALAAGVPVVAPDVGVAREAGATIAVRQSLGQATIDTLSSGARGRLKLVLPSKEEWAAEWLHTL